jgi:hypothetical protein
MELENLFVVLKLSFSKFIVSYLNGEVGGELDLWVELWRTEFEIDEIYVFGVDRNVNIWLTDHNSNDPLIIGLQYDLMLNIPMTDTDAISLSEGIFFRETDDRSIGFQISVSAYSDSFEIPIRTKKLLIPKKGDSESISFRIKPKFSGSHKLNLFFYYNLNLLKVLSIQFDVINSVSESRYAGIIQFEEPEFIRADVLGSNDKGFESILEIESSLHD